MEGIIEDIKRATRQVKFSNQVQDIIEKTVTHIPNERIDQKRSVFKLSPEEKYIHVNLYALSNSSIPLEITFAKMIDFYCDEASILEMEEVGTDIEQICQTINMWLVSSIKKMQFKRGDYVSRTDFIGTHKYMSSRRLFTRTTPFGRFGKKIFEEEFKPWIVL